MQSRRAPEWADPNTHDPAITIVELFAFVGDRLLAYGETIAAEARLPSRRWVVAIGAVASLGLLWLSRRSGDG